jgi:hypothetical protein
MVGGVHRWARAVPAQAGSAFASQAGSLALAGGLGIRLAGGLGFASQAGSLALAGGLGFASQAGWLALAGGLGFASRVVLALGEGCRIGLWARHGTGIRVGGVEAGRTGKDSGTVGPEVEPAKSPAGGSGRSPGAPLPAHGPFRRPRSHSAGECPIPLSRGGRAVL